MSETKLLSCPFCGGQLRRNMCGSFEDDNKGCILYGFEIHEKMIPMWNTRKPLERIVERLEERYMWNDNKKKELYEDEDWEALEYWASENNGIGIAIAIVKEEGGL